MRLLLDTCTFLWWTSADEKVPESTLKMLEEENEVLFSAISAWEVAIKSKLGRLELPAPARNRCPLSA